MIWTPNKITVLRVAVGFLAIGLFGKNAWLNLIAVALTVSAIKSHAVLEVADNGVGIPAEALPRVFDRFFRVDKARSRELGGAGLGLSIVKSICMAHHGHIEASSFLGQGSRFRVELPLAAPTTNNQKKHNHEH